MPQFSTNSKMHYLTLDDRLKDLCDAVIPYYDFGDSL